MVEKTECGVWSLSQLKCFDLAAILKQTPSFPLYGGIKWKTRILSSKCFFRFGGDNCKDGV